MDTFHPFCTLFQKHSFQPFSTLKAKKCVKTVGNRFGFFLVLSKHVNRTICKEDFFQNIVDSQHFKSNSRNFEAKSCLSRLR